MLQADLQQMLGPKVYDHVRELKTLGLINARRKGATLELTTTQRFPEYFGIESAKREDIKRFMAERAGIELGTLDPAIGAAEAPENEGAGTEGPETEAREAEAPETETLGEESPETAPEDDQV
jgi:hypothetical protein